MKYVYFFLSIIALISCNENLLEKPDNLIPEDKMVSVLMDLAIVNAAKSTNISVLHENDIEPMAYIFKKYHIDSLQFVQSDNYYASLPKGDYERIYTAVNAKLEKRSKDAEDAKVLRDSLAKKERDRKRKATDANKVKDSLP